MAGFLYYLPEGTTKDVIVPARFDDCGIIERGCDVGPDGKPGTVLTAKHDRAPKIGFFTDTQTWAKQPAGWWLGVETKNAPAPEDLARAAQAGGYPVPLGDGRRWTVPVGTNHAGDICLPKVFGYDDAGNMTKVVQKCFRPVFTVAHQVRDAFLHGHEISDDDSWAFCLAALNANYHIAEEEICHLGLLTEQAVVFIGWALVDRINWPDVDAEPAQAPASDSEAT